MRFVALAAGYDGTLARSGQCDERCVEMLRALAATGRKLILVTGRQLTELLEIFPEARIFDVVVAENGAVMHRPATRSSAILAQAPPEILLQELERRGVRPLSVGSSSITTLMSNLAQVRDALEKLGLDCQLVPNDGVLSVLPVGVDKAFGVQAALRELGVSPHNLVAIGDGQNDVALFQLAAYAAAVANAEETLHRVADRATAGAGCEGFLELARELIADDLVSAMPRNAISIARDDAARVSFTAGRDSLLVYGSSGGGATAIGEHIVDQLLLLGYQCCLLGAAPDRLTLCGPQVARFGAAFDPPRLTDVLSALENPQISAAVNLSALPAETRPVFAEALLLQLRALHERAGRPHCLLVEQAEALVSGEFARAAARLADITIIYTCSDAESLPIDVLTPVRYVIGAGGEPPPAHWKDRLGAAVQATTAGGGPCRISALRPPSPSRAPASSTDAVLSG